MSADASAIIIINPLDDIARRYGEQLLQLGGSKARLVMARALTGILIYLPSTEKVLAPPRFCACAPRRPQPPRAPLR